MGITVSDINALMPNAVRYRHRRESHVYQQTDMAVPEIMDTDPFHTGCRSAPISSTRKSGSRTPKEDVIQEMAKVLKVKPKAIADPDYNTYIGLMYMFFDLEVTYGIHVDEIDGELCLRLDRSRKDCTELFDMLLKWNEARKNGQTDFESSAAYEEWKLHYPPYGR